MSDNATMLVRNDIILEKDTEQAVKVVNGAGVVLEIYYGRYFYLSSSCGF